MVDYLIDHGANINTVDIKNRTLLHHAIKYGQFDIVKYLVDKGININALDDSNLSAFNYAANSNNKQTNALSHATNLRVFFWYDTHASNSVSA